MGAQDMHSLRIEFTASGAPSDAASIDFGIDEITSELTSPSTRVFKVNGKQILIRGAGYSPDMLLRETPAAWNTHFSYAKAMNLNTIRLEGKLVGDDFFALADRYGLLVMRRLVLLRSLGKMEELEIRRALGGHQIPARPGLAAAHPSQRVVVGQRQRRPAAARHREGLSGRAGRCQME